MKETNTAPIPFSNTSLWFRKIKRFYKNVLGCEEGRSSDHWVDFNLFGHQLVIHYKEKSIEKIKTNPVDGKDVPIPHFGVILEWNQFHNFSNQLIKKGLLSLLNPIFDLKVYPVNKQRCFLKIPAEMH